MRKKALILSVLLLALSVPAVAQYYQTGSAPAGTRWARIRSAHFDMIYPVEIDSLAREYVYSFEKTRTATLTGLHIDPPRMPMILQPYDMYSNGMVAWAPRRIELYTTPLGDPLYALNWEMQLAVHEGRHVGQMAHYTKGLFRVLNVILGEQGSAVGIGLHPTKVLFEGDAVQNETDLTSAGRGRDPEFLKYFRAAFVAGDNRKYVDWRYGSFRRYSPGKYPLGYLTLSSMRDISGNYFAAGDIIEEKARNCWKLFNVSRNAYIKGTGHSGGENWWLAVARNTELWQWEYKLRAPYTPTIPLVARRDRVYAELSNPVELGDETFVTMKGMQFERRIMSIDSLGRRHYRRPLSTTTSTLVADGGHSMLFSEIVPDPRWEHRSWSVIRRYDAETNSMTTLTRRSRYLNPAPSAGRDSILAAEYPVEGGSNVVILDREGKLIDRIPAPDKGQVTGVAQLRNDLYATVVTTEGIGIYRHDGSWRRVLAPQPKMIRNLQAAGDSILYFVSDLDGLSNVYALDPGKEGSMDGLMRLTSVRFSAEAPSFTDDGKLLFGDYDHLGYLPVAVPSDSLEWKQADFKHPYINELAERNAEQASSRITPVSAEEDSLLRREIENLESRPYSKILHGIHVHSWAPFYASIDRLMNDLGGFDRIHFSNWYEYVAPGATLVTQNELGTLVGSAGYSYHDHHHGAHAYLNYSGLYPVMALAVDFNGRSATSSTVVYRPGGESSIHLDTLSRPSLNVNAQISIPFNFSRGGWVTSLRPQINYVMTNDSWKYMEYGGDTGFSSERSQMLVGTLRFMTRLATPTSRLTPRFGFGFQVSARMNLGHGIGRRSVGAFDTWMYLPGFGKEDGFRLSYARQLQPQGALFYGTDFNLVKRPTGFSNEVFLNYRRASLQYALPIYAGDLDGGFFFYLKRLILIPFVDYAYDKEHPVITGNHIDRIVPTHYLSYGTSLMVTTRLFRIGSDLQFGVQYARPHRPGDHGSFRFVMSTGL